MLKYSGKPVVVVGFGSGSSFGSGVYVGVIYKFLNTPKAFPATVGVVLVWLINIVPNAILSAGSLGFNFVWDLINLPLLSNTSNSINPVSGLIAAFDIVSPPI